MSQNKANILLVDDDRDLLQLITLRLSAAGHAVHAVTSGEEALARLAVVRPQLVLTDMRMGGMDGMALFERIHAIMPTLPVIILTAHGTIPDAVDATRRGVFGFLTKPFDGQDLLAQVDQALKLGGGASSRSEEWRADIVTRSHVMEELLRQAKLVAATEASVLVLGEAGTGKELLAHALHKASRRAKAAFITVNCAALPEQLLESEMFGHTRGAFAGAVQAHKGLFQSAQGGTLFLDNIVDMPTAIQVKLLRALQERVVRPLGSTTDIPIDVRLICSAQRELGEAIRDGDFRQDLYYGLNVVNLRLPALAERREDIPLLSAHFVDKLAVRHRKPARAFAPEALELLVNAAWPGNVRQLINIVEQTVALSTSAVIPATLVQQALHDDEEGTLEPLDEARRAFERDYLVRLLKTTGGNVSQAARLAQRNRTEFYKLLQRHNLTPAMFKDVPNA